MFCNYLGNFTTLLKSHKSDIYTDNEQRAESTIKLLSLSLLCLLSVVGFLLFVVVVVATLSWASALSPKIAGIDKKCKKPENRKANQTEQQQQLEEH